MSALSPTMNRPRSIIAAAIAAALALTVAAGCGDSGGASQTPRPVTFEEATILAGALAADADAEYAMFAASYQPTAGESFTAEGTVLWTDLAGFGTAHTADGNADFRWTENLVQIAENGAIANEHAPDPSTNPLDFVIGTVMHLASKTADNPTLVQQNGATVVRSDDTTITFSTNSEPDAPILTIDVATGRVIDATFVLPGGGRLSIHLTYTDPATAVTATT